MSEKDICQPLTSRDLLNMDIPDATTKISWSEQYCEMYWSIEDEFGKFLSKLEAESRQRNAKIRQLEAELRQLFEAEHNLFEESDDAALFAFDPWPLYLYLPLSRTQEHTFWKTPCGHTIWYSMLQQLSPCSECLERRGGWLDSDSIKQQHYFITVHSYYLNCPSQHSFNRSRDNRGIELLDLKLPPNAK